MTVIDVSSVVEYGSYATYELTARGQPGNERASRDTRDGRLSTESRETMTNFVPSEGNPGDTKLV
jgi:hypothetical protein